jgi:hypothetical protein
MAEKCMTLELNIFNEMIYANFSSKEGCDIKNDK